MYLTDLAFIEEGTPNYTEDGLVNFSKMRMVRVPVPLQWVCVGQIGVMWFGARVLARSVPTLCSPHSRPSPAQHQMATHVPLHACMQPGWSLVRDVSGSNKTPLCIVLWLKGADRVCSTSCLSPSQVVGRSAGGDGCAVNGFCVLSPDRFHTS